MHGEVELRYVGYVLAECAALIAVFGPLTMVRYRHER
jgi:hypothetical protein